jgi:hypothetical protein
VDRVAWDDLPAELKEAITARTGQITAIRTPGAGLNSPLAAIITAKPPSHHSSSTSPRPCSGT